MAFEAIVVINRETMGFEFLSGFEGVRRSQVSQKQSARQGNVPNYIGLLIWKGFELKG